MGMNDVRDAFINRHAAAQREDQNRDDERPKVKFFSVTKWMIVIGWLSALPQAEQKQCAIARVDERMNRFREHRRATGKKRRDEFRNRDRQVRDNGREDGEL